jgi:hypothetical protein
MYILTISVTSRKTNCHQIRRQILNKCSQFFCCRYKGWWLVQISHYQRGVDEDPYLLRHWICNNSKREATSFSETLVIIYNSSLSKSRGLHKSTNEYSTIMRTLRPCSSWTLDNTCIVRRLQRKKTFWASLSDSVNAESVLVQVLV